jgi:hypothetical protein
MSSTATFFSFFLRRGSGVTLDIDGAVATAAPPSASPASVKLGASASIESSSKTSPVVTPASPANILANSSSAAVALTVGTEPEITIKAGGSRSSISPSGNSCWHSGHLTCQSDLPPSGMVTDCVHLGQFEIVIGASDCGPQREIQENCD